MDTFRGRFWASTEGLQIFDLTLRFCSKTAFLKVFIYKLHTRVWKAFLPSDSFHTRVWKASHPSDRFHTRVWKASHPSDRSHTRVWESSAPSDGFHTRVWETTEVSDKFERGFRGIPVETLLIYRSAFLKEASEMLFNGIKTWFTS